MDLRQLRHFLAVVEQGSILRAARTIHLTQPALSRSIQSLEDELGVRLFERGRRGIEPTPHGLLLMRHATGLVAQAEEARTAVRCLGSRESLRLVLGAGTNLAGVILPKVVARMVNELPHLTVDLRDGSAEDLVTALQRREIDVALCAWPAAGLPPDVTFDEVLRSDLAVVCRPSHPLARRRRVRLEELATHRWALAERPRAIGHMLRLAFAAAALPPPDPVVRSTSLNFLLPLLQEADLLSLLPAAYLAAERHEGRLVQLATDLPPATSRVGFLRRAIDATPDPAIELFLDGVRAALGPFNLARRSVQSRQRD